MFHPNNLPDVCCKMGQLWSLEEGATNAENLGQTFLRLFFRVGNNL